jgi:hypothetical protein
MHGRSSPSTSPLAGLPSTPEPRHPSTCRQNGKARSEAEAKSETDVLNLKLDKAFFEKRKQSGVQFNRTAHSAIGREAMAIFGARSYS